jgi:hypothetical protein
LSIASIAPLFAVAVVPFACGGNHVTRGSFDVPDSGTSAGDDAGATGPDDDAGSHPPGTTDSGVVGTFKDAGAPPPPAPMDAMVIPIDAEGGCAQVMETVTRQPVYMLFVQDGSGSMRHDNKWAAVVPALETIFADMSMKADPGVGAGLIVFSDSLDTSGPGGPYPESIDVPVGFVSAAQDMALTQRLSGTPTSSTPTQAGLTGAYNELDTFMPAPPLPAGGKKVVVLITDGVPTDGCKMSGAGYANNPCVQLAAAKLAPANPADAILTFVIGVGIYPTPDPAVFDPAFLGNLALAGGSGAMGCDPNQNAAGATNLCYFQVDPTLATSAAQLQQTFEQAINAIRGQVVSCTFPLRLTDAGTIDPTQVSVTVGSMAVAQDPANGWSYDDPTSPTAIVFHGTSCAGLMSDPSAQVQVVVGCEGIVVPPPPPPPPPPLPH